MRLLIVVVVTAAALLGGSGAAAAHATVQLTVHSDGRGSVSVDVVWADGHPVTEPVAATMTAVAAVAPTAVAATASAASAVGPVALTRLPGRPTVVYGGTLPAGEWRITVDTALPGIGHCEAVVRVGGADSRPSSTRCGTPAPAPTAAAAAPGGGGVPRPIWIVGAAALALAAAYPVRRMIKKKA
ncbi:hypothetical protein WEI85_32250 [Actinomycetes bacterium KLBMP 9797]